MDRLSQLHDELLLVILSSLPNAKDVVSTMILSKRWKFLWMMVPRLVYDNTTYKDDVDYVRFSTFVDSSLLLHKAPVIETLHFKLTCGSADNNIPVFIRSAADKHCVHDLIIENPSRNTTPPTTLPRSLFTCYKMLVTLKVKNAIIVDDVIPSSPFSFPSLKKLSLISVKYPGDEFFNMLISSCPVLEDLVVEEIFKDNVAFLRVRVPSLKSLVLHRNGKEKSTLNGKAHGFVIDTPSLESMDIFDLSQGSHIVENDMPNIVKATIDIFHPHTEKLMGSITLAKYLHLCLPTSENVSHPAGSVFNRLVHLRLCTCETEWLNLLMRLLRNSPSLRVLELEQVHYLRDYQPRPCWNEPSSIPECLLCSLETFKWECYNNEAKEEKEVAAFILRSARCLKKATITSHKSTAKDKKLEMQKELSLLPLCSPICQLAFS